LGFALRADAPANAATINIGVGNLWFCSEAFDDGDCVTTLTAGDTVTWTGVEGTHTATECDATHTNCGIGFDSGVLEAGQTYSQTFPNPGQFYYYCAFHPSSMFGTLIVQAAETPTPAPSPGAATQPPAAAPAANPSAVPKTGGAPLEEAGTLPWLWLGLALLAVGGSGLVLARRR
jgi:hypothetical protein